MVACSVRKVLLQNCGVGFTRILSQCLWCAVYATAKPEPFFYFSQNDDVAFKPLVGTAMYKSWTKVLSITAAASLRRRAGSPLHQFHTGVVAEIDPGFLLPHVIGVRTGVASGCACTL